MTDGAYGGMEEGLVALERDLLSEDGPQISPMRNYQFAIVPYLPSEEFKLRRKVLQLVERLRGEGWSVLPISLQKVLLERIRRTGDENVAHLVDREKRLSERDPARGLTHLRDKIAHHIEGLYPFFRSSALLKHLDGKTRNIPVVLLYPGKRADQNGLEFMCELPADRDYRPRIYP
jgi:hypothetical protein